MLSALGWAGGGRQPCILGCHFHHLFNALGPGRAVHMEAGTSGSQWQPGLPGPARQGHIISYAPGLDRLAGEDCCRQAMATLATVSWGEAEGSGNHGSWSWKRPTWSSSLFLRHGLIIPPGYSGAVCKICFRMTQAGSLPAIPLGDGAAFSVEEVFSPYWLGSFVRWLQPHRSWLVSLRPP